MADPKHPKAHEDTYRNVPSLKDLPHTGTERDGNEAAKDPSAGRTDERRSRPGKDDSEAEHRARDQQARQDKGNHDGGKGQSGLSGGTGPVNPRRPHPGGEKG